jgi:hypothetical protein
MRGSASSLSNARTAPDSMQKCKACAFSTVLFAFTYHNQKEPQHSSLHALRLLRVQHSHDRGQVKLYTKMPGSGSDCHSWSLTASSSSLGSRTSSSSGLSQDANLCRAVRPM